MKFQPQSEENAIFLFFCIFVKYCCFTIFHTRDNYCQNRSEDVLRSCRTKNNTAREVGSVLQTARSPFPPRVGSGREEIWTAHPCSPHPPRRAGSISSAPGSVQSASWFPSCSKTWRPSRYSD